MCVADGRSGRQTVRSRASPRGQEQKKEKEAAEKGKRKQDGRAIKLHRCGRGESEEAYGRDRREKRRANKRCR
jgi:hypothetical protein